MNLSSSVLGLSEQLALIAPLLVIGGGSLLLLVTSILSPQTPAGRQISSQGIDSSTQRTRLGGLELLVFVILVFALFCLMQQLGHFKIGLTVFQGVLFTDGLAGFFSVLIIVGTVLSLMISAGLLSHHGVTASCEYYTLLLMSTFGALIFANAAELITMFLGLEIMSMALYCLCGAVIPHPTKRDERAFSTLPAKRSAESALKYFLLGSFSSAFLLYGIAIVYGLTGSTQLQVIAQSAGSVNPLMLSLAIGMMFVGLGFKMGLVPFHFWTPDVYQGAPTAVTAYMACVIKAAAVAAAIRVITIAFGDQVGFWAPAVWIVAVLTMTIGNLLALRQKVSAKRLLAYSSISHAGYMLAGFLAFRSEYGGAPAILFYLVSYTLMTIGAFAIVMALSVKDKDVEAPDNLKLFDGLSSRRPALAAVMSIFLLSLAGIPPGMAGFVGKFFVFSAAVRADYIGLVIIGVINSAISCYYYLHIIVRMYFGNSDAQHHIEVSREQPSAEPGLGYLTASAIGICLVGVIVLGLFPSGIYEGLRSLFGGSPLLR